MVLSSGAVISIPRRSLPSFFGNDCDFPRGGCYFSGEGQILPNKESDIGGTVVDELDQAPY